MPTQQSLLEGFLLRDPDFPIDAFIAQISKQLQLYELSNDESNQTKQQKFTKILNLMEQYKILANKLIQTVQSMEGASVDTLRNETESSNEAEEPTQGEQFHKLRMSFEKDYLPKLLSFIRTELLKSARRIAFRKASPWKHCQKAEHLALAFKGYVSNDYIMKITSKSMDRAEYEKELDECLQKTKKIE